MFYSKPNTTLKNGGKYHHPMFYSNSIVMVSDNLFGSGGESETVNFIFISDAFISRLFRRIHFPIV
jgi:hypothetical protein